MSTKRLTLKIVLPIVVLAAGVALYLFLLSQQQRPAQRERENRGVLVETITVKPQSYRIEVRASGTVQPRLLSRLAPQVSGRVVAVSPRLVEGGFFRKGEELFRLEPLDFELAVQQAKANIAEATRNLLTIESRAKIARQEWQTLNAGSTKKPNPLVLFKPQLTEARARLVSRRAALEQAQVNLERTRVVAPFNGRVTEERLDAGQYVRAGDPVVTLVGTDVAEIVLPVPLTELAWLKVPGADKSVKGSAAEIHLPGQKEQWQGKITRSLAEVDPRGRMPRLAVSVDDPFNLKTGKDRPDLTLGLFVEVVLFGPQMEEKIQIPRAALRENNTVWLADDGILTIQPVEVMRIQQDRVLIEKGLRAGQLVVVTPLAGAADGMKLRVRQGS